MGGFLPTIITGTSSLGNLYEDLSYESKLAIVREAVKCSSTPAVFDCAGKYGAGLALETLGKCLQELEIGPLDIIVSNKLGWLRKPLLTDDPTFEPGVWKNIQYDAYQKINYYGILECFEEGNILLGQYRPALVSIHDPDEYLAAATDDLDYQKRWNDILQAYKALAELKKEGKVKSIGIGAKNWKVIQLISGHVDLDWAMFANCLTVYQHPSDLLAFIQQLKGKGIIVINSAIFHGGFLTGGQYFDYKPIQPDTAAHRSLLQWRNEFQVICRKFNILPAEACINFALQVPGIQSIALSSRSPERIRENMNLANAIVPDSFWKEMKDKGLIDRNYPYAGF